MEIKPGTFNADYNNKTLGDFLKDLNLTEDLEASLNHINETDEIKKRLAASIEQDIQQYLPDVADIWGDETVRVTLKGDDAFVVWKDCEMPTIDFYKLVSLNGGVVTPDDFKKYKKYTEK